VPCAIRESLPVLISLGRVILLDHRDHSKTLPPKRPPWTGPRTTKDSTERTS
jgi:hypothetical protein